MPRTQITLTEKQHRRLARLSRATGISMSELIRQAVDRVYSRASIEELRAALRSWQERDLQEG
jgi:hypothetical protein